MESMITSVILYPDRARLTRCGEVALKEGVQQIEIPNLSNFLDPDSLRVNARGSAQVRLLGLRVQKKYLQDTPEEYVRDLEAQLESAQDDLTQVEAQISLVDEQKSKLSDLTGHTGIYARSLAKGELTVESQLAIYDNLRARSERLEAERQNLVRHRRELEKRLQKIKGQLDQIKSARPRERFYAYVEVEVIQPGNLTIELVYMVSTASWKPLYDIRLLDQAGEFSLDIGFLAQISQRTGENWSGVELSLSTARPALGNILPELNPWYISPPKPLPIRGRHVIEDKVASAAPMMSENFLVKSANAEDEEEYYDAEHVVAEVGSSPLAVTYSVPGKVVVPTNGEPHKVTIARFGLKPELDYVTAPKIEQAAYRRATITNDSQYTLLPGSANIFVGDEYIGATPLELVATQGEMELYLGVEDRVRVERELKRRQVDKTLIGGKRRLHYAYEIKLQNNTSRDITLTIYDQIPVSRHEDIKVKLVSVQPEPKEQSELNILEWKLSLAAGEKSQIRFDFDVEHPPDMQVFGLN